MLVHTPICEVKLCELHFYMYRTALVIMPSAITITKGGKMLPSNYPRSTSEAKQGQCLGRAKNEIQAS